jgi:hypothetical protein
MCFRGLFLPSEAVNLVLPAYGQATGKSWEITSWQCMYARVGRTVGGALRSVVKSMMA